MRYEQNGFDPTELAFAIDLLYEKYKKTRSKKEKREIKKEHEELLKQDFQQTGKKRWNKL